METKLFVTLFVSVVKLSDTSSIAYNMIKWKQLCYYWYV